MKVTVSIPNAVFQRAERLGARSGLSRSKLYTAALDEYIRLHGDELTRTMNRACRTLRRDRDGFTLVAARRVLERTEFNT